MSNKTLQEKIDLVKWCAIGFTILYIIVGAFLVSDYPLKKSTFDPVKTYNLIKDALTITAYFLAPIAAFVLFSDWRKEYRSINNEKVVLDIFPRVKETSNKIKDMVSMVVQNFQESPLEMIEIYTKEVLLRKKEVLKEIAILENTEGSFQDKKFHEKCLVFYQSQYELLETLHRLFESSDNLENCKNSPTEPEYMTWAIGDTARQEEKFYASAESYLEVFCEEMKELHALADTHRVL